MAKLQPAVAVALLGAVLAGASGVAMAGPGEALVGTWSHSIDTPEGAYVGTITLVEESDRLAGTIGFDSPSVAPTPLVDVALAGSDLAFAFSSEYGRVSVKITFEGSTFSGTVDVPDAGVFGLAIRGNRKAE